MRRVKRPDSVGFTAKNLICFLKLLHYIVPLWHCQVRRLKNIARNDILIFWLDRRQGNPYIKRKSKAI
jgi:hypothetical protein